jgi:uncharacterized membrane protein YraQ (UPF0718 family)
MIGKDILLGVLISGFLMTFVPTEFWRSLFLQNGPAEGMNGLKVIENGFVGPLVAVASFVCSVGNIPMASVLYKGGISFGGAISFIYGDLIIIPLILIYRRYYGWKLALWITGIFYVSMAITGIIVDLVFNALGWVPDRSSSFVGMPLMHEHLFEINYTFWLNGVFLVLALGMAYLARSSGPAQSDCCH